MSPAIREIRRIYPQAHITMLINARFIPFAEICPYVDELIIRPILNEFPIEGYLMITPELLQRRYDIAYSFKSGASHSLIMYMSGARTRIINYATEDKMIESEKVPSRYFANLATITVPIPIERYRNHAVDIFLSVVEGILHAPVTNREIEIWYTPADFSSMQSLIKNVSRPLYALAMGASGFNNRCYPAEKYSQLVKMILNEDKSATIFVLGGGQYEVFAVNILKQILGEKIFSERIIDLTNKISFRQSSVILSNCDMYIGNYTGTMHVAAAVKCPVLAVHPFPTDLHSDSWLDTEIFAPYKVPSVVVQPVHALDDCKVNSPYWHIGCRANSPHCITQIEPKTIFKGFHILKDKIKNKLISTSYIK